MGMWPMARGPFSCSPIHLIFFTIVTKQAKVQNEAAAKQSSKDTPSGLIILVILIRVRSNLRIFDYKLFLKYLSFKYGDNMYRLVLKNTLIRLYIY